LCGAATCGTGCCLNGACQKNANTDSACGANGGFCDVCTGNNHCSPGHLCEPQGGCNCPTGCCDINNQCHSGKEDGACGYGTLSCRDCAAQGEVCNKNSGNCEPAIACSCPNGPGCCGPADHQCHAGNTNAACGLSGFDCEDCGLNSTCMQSAGLGYSCQ
jgi:hypothetical protein